MEQQQQLTDETTQESSTRSAEQLSFLSLINVSLDKLSQLKEARQMAKESLDSELLQHEEYAVKAEAAKKAMQEKKAVLKRLERSPNVADIKERIKDITAQVKDEKQSLGVCGLAYVKETGANLIERNGKNYFIALIAKVTKASKK